MAWTQELRFSISRSVTANWNRVCTPFTKSFGPHPHGLCGSRIDETLDLLCVGGYNEYPSYGGFRRKREISEIFHQFYIEIKYDVWNQTIIPAGVIESNLWKCKYEKWSTFHKKTNVFLIPDLRGHLEDLSGILIRRQEANSYLVKRSSFYERGIVCECCYHRCSVFELFSYCRGEPGLLGLFKRSVGEQKQSFRHDHSND